MDHLIEKNISYDNLPSVKFENEIKELMDYTTFKSYKKNITTEGEIDKWIQRFQTKLGEYSTFSSEDSSDNHDKRCKHFNYLINVTINDLNSLSDNIIKTLGWSKEIKKCRDNFLHSNNNLNCNKDYKYSDGDYKILGTFCEDSDFIKRNLVEIQNSVYCTNIANNMTSRKNILINILHEKGIRAGRILQIDDECSIQLLDKIFPTIICNSSDESTSQADKGTPNSNYVSSDKSSEELMIQQSPDDGVLTTNKAELVTTSGEVETKDSTSSNTLNTVGLPIFGVLGCSFLFYKFTPVGTIFRSRIQNKGIIPINNDGYSKKQILSNIPNTNDISPENTQYKISYQTL